MTDGQKVSHSTSINSLPYELLLNIFEFCRLGDIYGWNHRHRWCTLLHVCRKWQCIILESASSLKLRLLCNYVTPVSEMLLHFLPLPLIVEFDIDTYALPLYQEKIHPALQHHHRVVSLFIRQWSWVDPMKHMALDNAFPILETLSLSSADYTTKALPNNFVAPRLRSLSLSKVAISAASSLLANLAEIVSLDIEYIPNYDDILPEYLVEVLSGFPHLENLCISPRLPSTMVRELRRTTRITRVVLPSLLTFKYEGVSGYLENLLALISTPLLRCFRVMFGPKLTSALPCLSDFLGTIQNPDVGIAEISFLPSVVFVTYHPAQPSSSLSSFSFSIHGDCDKANMVEICGATAPAFPAVQRLLLFARREGDSQMSKEYWHAFLRLFGGVTTLQTDIYLTAQLSDALRPHNGLVAKGLLPRLSELVIVSKEGLVHDSLISFIHAYCLAENRINFRLVKESPPPIWVSRSNILLFFPIFE